MQLPRPKASPSATGMFSRLPRSPYIAVEFNDLTYTVPAPSRKGQLKNEKKTILDAVSGAFGPGQLTAILGPSGAGKSSLLNVLAGHRVRGVEGTVLVNGAARSLQAFRKLQAYILQEDVLLPYLSAEECMMAAAALKLGAGLSERQRRRRVDDVLEALGLSACRRTRCLRLSGGQRKRLSIALELLNNPPVMFFDEPTSGLDSKSSSSCVSLLKTLAEGGRTIICTIHQPSSRLFQLFDQLYVLADGRCIYRGSRANLVPALAAAGLHCPAFHNPADFVMEAACGEYGDWTDRLSAEAQNGRSLAWTGDGGAPEKAASADAAGKGGAPEKAADGGATENTATQQLALQQQPADASNENGAANTEADHLTNGLASSRLNGVTSEKTNALHLSPAPPSSVTESEVDSASFLLDAPACGRRSKDQCQRPSSGEQNQRAGDTAVWIADREAALKPDPVKELLWTAAQDPARELHRTSVPGPARELHRTSGWNQFCVLLKRTMRSIVRDRMLTAMRLVSHVLFGLLIGSLYYNIGNEASDVYNNAAQLFFALLFVMFSSLMPTILTFPLEMSVFKKEYLNCWYSVKAYYLAKTAADLPFQIVFPLIYNAIVYFMTSQPAEWVRFWMFCLMTTLTSLVAQSIGLVIGTCCGVQLAVFMGPITMIPVILFSGFFVNLNKIPVWLAWVSYLSYARYSFQGLMISVYGYGRADMHCSLPYCHFKSPSKFLKEMDMLDADYWACAGVLIAMTCGLRLAGYFVLRFKLKLER